MTVIGVMYLYFSGVIAAQFHDGSAIDYIVNFLPHITFCINIGIKKAINLINLGLNNRSYLPGNEVTEPFKLVLLLKLFFYLHLDAIPE
jgi:hypothetical protein